MIELGETSALLSLVGYTELDTQQNRYKSGKNFLGLALMDARVSMVKDLQKPEKTTARDLRMQKE